MSSKFNAFYREKVVLSQQEQTNLTQKKNTNIKRLKDGLKEYNDNKKTSYNIVETCVQGSMAMSTIVQNDSKDYDIDVAVVFEKSNLGEKGPLAVRNIVAEALRLKTKQFNAEPEVKTSCVRVKYQEGYHIDFAVYRRSYDSGNDCWIYEHAGSEWSKRELNGLTEWFSEQNSDSEQKLRKVVRLSKMFCNSRDTWKNMPSGLLQTVLCDEKLQRKYDRLDELFYYTMKEITYRLENDTSVNAPVDNGRDLTPRKTDKTKMVKWKNRLNSKLGDLGVLFNEDCTLKDALQAWYGFFQNDFWIVEEPDNTDQRAYSTIIKNTCSYIETEEFIEDIYDVIPQYSCDVSCQVSGNGFRPCPIGRFLTLFNKYLPYNLEIRCEMEETNCPPPYTIMWKVKNVGPEAERRNMVRGQIVSGKTSIVEHSNFYGNHYIECYIIKNGICVARNKIDIPIGWR